MGERPKVPKATEVRVLEANRHTCCICHKPHLHVVLHHIDGDPSNHNDENLAVICGNDHSRVTGDEGLGRRFSQEEVREYKRQWEAHCAELLNSSSDEETEGEEGGEEDDLLENDRVVERIKAGEHSVHDFDLSRGQQLVATISSDEYLQVFLCDPSDYSRYERKGQLTAYYDNGEDVRECQLTMTAPRKGTYCLVLINDEENDADVAIAWEVWRSG